MSTELTIQAAYISNFAITGYSPAVGDTVQLLWELVDDGIDDDGNPRLRGTGPVVAATIYTWDVADGRFEDAGGGALPAFSPAPTIYDGPYLLYIPQFQIDPTSDWLRPRPGRYRVFFRLPDGRRKAWEDWQDIVVPVDPNPARLFEISVYNKGGVGRFGYDEVYTKEEVDAKITAALVGLLTNPMTALGDLIYGGAVVGGFATPTRRQVGTAGQFMRVSGGLPNWDTVDLADIVALIGYTPENQANKGAASGYAPLDGSTKVALAYLSEVLGLGNLTDVANGAVPTNNHFLVGNGSAWSNRVLASGDITTALGYTPENVANKGAAGGYASLDGSTKLPVAQLPVHTTSLLSDFASAVQALATAGYTELLLKLTNANIHNITGSGAQSINADAFVFLTSTNNTVSGVTVTLPDADAEPGRILIYFRLNLNPWSTHTIQPAGGDVLIDGTGTSVAGIAMDIGEFAIFCATDAGTWQTNARA